MHVRSFAGFVIAALAMFMPSLSAAAPCCSFNGSPCNIIPPLEHGVFPWTGSVCGTTITGDDCDARLGSTDGTASSGDCITLGDGVNFDLNGRTLNCTSGACNYAILNTNSGSNQNAVEIINGDITGCWGVGIFETGGSNTTVSDIFVDLAGSCSGPTNGILHVAGAVDRVVIANAANIAFQLVSGKTLKNSVVRDSALGIKYSYTGNYAAFDNVLVLNNDVSLNNLTPGSGIPSMQRSELLLAGTCHCQDNSACTDLDDCVTLTNSTTPTMVDDAIIP